MCPCTPCTGADQQSKSKPPLRKKHQHSSTSLLVTVVWLLRFFPMEAQAEGHGLWELPEGLLRVVLNKISAEDVACLRCTCKALAVVASDDAVWKDKFMEWQHASARWVTDGRSWLAKYSERKKVWPHIGIPIMHNAALSCARAWATGDKASASPVVAEISHVRMRYTAQSPLSHNTEQMPADGQHSAQASPGSLAPARHLHNRA